MQQPDTSGDLASNHASRAALRGVKVVDLSRLVAGNMLSLQLADFGADVIKVESPREGDTLRHWREDRGPEKESLDAWWRVYGRNKRSLAIDLRDGASSAILRSLLEGAQVLIESFRPGTLEAMGLGPDALHAINPKLVIVRLSGWGQTGPYRDFPGFGSLVEGLSGFAYKHSDQGSPRLPNMALADMIAGLTGTYATLAALREVEVGGGCGQVIDLSLLEPMLAVMGPDVTTFAATGRMADPATKIASPRGVYRCKDGAWVALSGSTDSMARRVLEAIGQKALIDDPRFSNNASRLQHDHELDRLIGAAISEMDLDQCLAIFRQKGVTVGPIYSAGQLLSDQHVKERSCYVQLDDSEGTLVHNVTPRLSATPGRIQRNAPEIGEHTEEVLREIGVSDADIHSMVERGAIRCN